MLAKHKNSVTQSQTVVYAVWFDAIFIATILI